MNQVGIHGKIQKDKLGLMVKNMVSIDVDAIKVSECIKNNNNFISPFSEPYGYYICILNQNNKGTVDDNMVELYLSKLKYVAENTDTLINQAFLMFQSSIGLPKTLWQKLMFESFVLLVDAEEIACCLSNRDFMAGHYIECRWDFDWNLIFICYC